MRNLFYAALFLFSTFAYGQIIFEKGYIIDNNGDKKEVLIKNYEWKNNPSIIEYKLENNEDPLKIKTSDLQEFHVGNQKYIMATVMIDRSSSKIEELSAQKDFNSKEENVLLKLIVEGKINLYKYSDGVITRFFYKREDEKVYRALNYKEYLINNQLIQKNEEFKNQLGKEFSDNEKITSKQISALRYSEDGLEKIFKVYDNLIEEKTKNKNNFHIYIKPGLGFSTYNIQRSENPLFMNWDESSVLPQKQTNTILSISAEFEYVLNFNKGKWALISEPTYQATKFNVNDFLNTNFEIKYSSLLIPFGIKHNMFLNQKSKIYISASIYYQLLLNKNTFTTNNNFASASDKVSRSISVGYNYDRFGAELKWGGSPYITTYYDGPYNGTYYNYYHNIKMNGFNLSVSYKLF